MKNHQEDITDYLNSWEKLDRYSQWLYHMYSDHIGKRIVDIGGGVGNAIRQYIDRVDGVIATELFMNDVDIMNERFSDVPYFRAVCLDIMSDDISELCEFNPDTVICINCLEHIEDDIGAMSIMKRIVSTDGKIVICVPAVKNLYCYMDENVGHYRRYTKGELREKATLAGLTVVDDYYMNIFGIVPYWIRGRVGNVNKKESFSSSIGEAESKLYSIATRVLEPVERLVRPFVGISEFIILKKDRVECI